MVQPRPPFRLFSVFSNQQYNFYSKSMWKMSHQYSAQGFKPMTFWTWVVTHNHWTRAPAQITFFFRLEFFHSFMLPNIERGLWRVIGRQKRRGSFWPVFSFRTFEHKIHLEEKVGDKSRHILAILILVKEDEKESRNPSHQCDQMLE